MSPEGAWVEGCDEVLGKHLLLADRLPPPLTSKFLELIPIS